MSLCALVICKDNTMFTPIYCKIYAMKTSFGFCHIQSIFLFKDPEAKKADDWDEREQIDDPEDSKPEDWDQPEHIADPEAKKPDDWDDEMDGEWEPPMIDNPDYKGEWKPRQIDNPNYSGKWVHPEIDNPEYTPGKLCIHFPFVLCYFSL